MPINKEYVPIDNQPTIKPRTVTGIFTRYIAKTLPLAFDESMSYYECLCALLEYINTKVIPALDNNAAGLLELQEFYEELQTYVNDYFKNLDVQEEINNKLDEMTESGQLTDIIAQYLGLAGMITFDNVADMKLAENLVNGSKCRTLGFHSVNDGGGAYYKIRTVTNDDVIDEMTIIKVYDNLLVAELIIDDMLNVKQLGAYGDGEHDDTTNVIKAINYTKENNTLYFPEGNYLITNTIRISKNINIKSDGIIISDNCRPLFILDKCINTIIDIYKIHDKRQNNLVINESEINNTPIVLKNTQYVKINIEEIKNFNIGILLISSNEATWGGCYYNSIHVKKFDSCFHGIYLLSLTGGSTNGNIFNDIVYQYHTWNTEEIPYFITIKNISGNNYYNNANNFYKLCAEYGVHAEGGPRLLNIVNGQNNFFEFDRIEIASTSNSTPFVFGENARCNQVISKFNLSNFSFIPDINKNIVHCPVQFGNLNRQNNIKDITSDITFHENITLNSGIVFIDYIKRVVYMHLILQTTDVISGVQHLITGIPIPTENIQHYCPCVESDNLYTNVTKLVPIYISRSTNTLDNRTYLGANETIEIDLVYRISNW